MLDPAKFSLSERPFHTEGEYLESLFVVLDLLLFRDADSRMEERGLSAGQDAEDWMRLIRDRLEMTEAAGGRLSTERILEKLEAPDYLRYLLAFLVKCSLDPVYESLAAAERGRNSLTLYDFCEMFAVPAKKEDPAAIYGMLERSRKPLKLLFPAFCQRTEYRAQHCRSASRDGRSPALRIIRAGRGRSPARGHGNISSRIRRAGEWRHPQIRFHSPEAEGKHASGACGSLGAGRFRKKGGYQSIRGSCRAVNCFL